jgi:uncharacterized protein with GYD domain
MATYIMLVNFTEQGIRNFNESPKRAQAFEELIEQLGGSLRGNYYTMGAYDIVAVLDVADDETATAAALKASSLGNVRTTTMRAFEADEVEAIIEKAG